MNTLLLKGVFLRFKFAFIYSQLYYSCLIRHNSPFPSWKQTVSQKLKFLIKKQMFLWAKLKPVQLLHFTKQAPLLHSAVKNGTDCKLFFLIGFTIKTNHTTFNFSKTIFKDSSILETSVIFWFTALDFYINGRTWMQKRVPAEYRSWWLFLLVHLLCKIDSTLTFITRYYFCILVCD